MSKKKKGENLFYYRLAEGNGEAIYEIGIDDDGTIKGMEKEKRIHSKTYKKKVLVQMN